MIYHSNLTSKGQVTVPKPLRDALELLPGHGVAFELDANGDVRILKADGDTGLTRRKAAMAGRLREVRGRYRPEPAVAGMDGLEYQAWIRGDGPEV